MEKENKKINNLVKYGTIVKNMFIKFKIIIIIILVVLLITIGYNLPSVLETKETVVNFGFENVGKLITQEWYGRMLEDSSKDRKLFKNVHIPFTESRLIFSIDVEVLAGINFEDIEYDVSIKDKKITIKLPKATIQDAHEVKGSFIAYLDDESIFTNINTTEQAKLKDKIVDKGEKQAKESGILEKADKNAKNIIENMIKGNAISKDFKIVYKYKGE